MANDKLYAKVYRGQNKDIIAKKRNAYYIEHIVEAKQRNKNSYNTQRLDRLIVRKEYVSLQNARFTDVCSKWTSGAVLTKAEYDTMYREFPRSKYTIHKAGAKYRSISFEITFEEFMQFWQKDCYYCGKSISSIGLDRIDSTKGYTTDNIVSCCSTCNTAKSTLTQLEFYGLAYKIVKFHPQGV